MISHHCKNQQHQLWYSLERHNACPMPGVVRMFSGICPNYLAIYFFCFLGQITLIRLQQQNSRTQYEEGGQWKLVLLLICNCCIKHPLPFVWGSGSFVPDVNFCHNDSRLASSAWASQSSVKHCCLFLHPQKWSLGISGIKWQYYHWLSAFWLDPKRRKEGRNWADGTQQRANAKR